MGCTQHQVFKKYTPLVSALRAPGMRDRHWDIMSEQIGMDLHRDQQADFTLQKGLDMGLLTHLEAITKVSDVAMKEYSIETTLDKMQAEWKEQVLGIVEYRETGTFVVRVDETVTQLLDDHIVMTQAMGFSPFKKPFEERIVQWEAALSLASEILDEWVAVQRSWMYLEPIFSSDDIMQQLPLEGKRFATVDRRCSPLLNFTTRLKTPIEILLKP
jgi:dynein heavy chain